MALPPIQVLLALLFCRSVYLDAHFRLIVCPYNVLLGAIHLWTSEDTYSLRKLSSTLDLSRLSDGNCRAKFLVFLYHYDNTMSYTCLAVLE